MGFRLRRAADGTIDWEVWNTAYGWIGGNASTPARAEVELAIAERELFEDPYPESVAQMMRQDPERTTADWRHVPIEEGS